MKLPAFSMIVGLACGASTASAQHYVAVEDNGKMVPVLAAHDTQPMVLKGDKLTPVRSLHLALREGGQYLTCFVAVRDVKVETAAAFMEARVNETKKEFRVSCELETPFSLTNVFLVMVLHPDFGDTTLFLYEVGQLEPRAPRLFEAPFPLEGGTNLGKCEFFFFSGGRELLHSLMPPGLVEAALNRMVRERIKDVRDASAQPLIGPAPEYPKALFKKGTEGSATVMFTIGVNGAISDPVVREASQPEFGEAAVAAIRQWRFLPKVKDGVPLATKATMPFVFAPPK
jgi:TonB family protein